MPVNPYPQKELEDALFPRLVVEEDMVLKPYLDCCGRYWRECTCPKKGILTIAGGVNLDIGLTRIEGNFLTRQRLVKAIEAAQTFPWFAKLNFARQQVVADMIFNLGLKEFSLFRKMNEALAAGDFKTAAQEMLDSRWHKQVHGRAERLAKAMEDG